MKRVILKDNGLWFISDTSCIKKYSKGTAGIMSLFFGLYEKYSLL